MSITRKVAFNTIVQIFGKVLTTIISLILIAALTRYLGVSGFGAYTTIYAFCAFLGVLADFGFFWILVRNLAQKEYDSNKLFQNLLTFRTVLAIIVYIVGSLVALVAIPQYSLVIKQGIVIIAAATFFITLNSTLVGVFQVHHRMDKAAITDVIGRLVILGTILTLIHYHFSLLVILSAYLIGNFVNFGLSLILVRPFIRVGWRFDWPLWRKIFAQAWPMGIVLILGLTYFKVDTIIISIIRGTKDVGIYGAPYKILEILIIIPAIFLGNIFPFISRFAKENRAKLLQIYQKAFDFLVIIALPVLVGVFVLAKPIIRIVAGQEYLSTSTVSLGSIPANSALVLQILIFAVCISFISQLFNYSIIAFGQQRKLILPNIILVIFNVMLNIILVGSYSYLASSFITVATEGLVVFLYGLIVYRYLGALPRINLFGRVLLIALIMGAVLFWLRSVNFWWLLILGAIIYLGGIYLLGIFNWRILKGLISDQWSSQ